MSYAIGIAAVLLLALAALEIGARLYHRRRFGVPFHSKVIGEYPYSAALEQVDPPLHFRFKKNFSSPMLNMNRLRCRGEQPAPDGQKKRLLLIGESTFFGVKLQHERQNWNARLENLLQENGHGDWEVLNAGNPTYNSAQHRLLWEREFKQIKPDILIVAIGFNDLFQAWVMGSKWQPGTPWPWKFVMALERKSPWWNKIASRFCLYFMLRRQMSARKDVPRRDEDLQWDACLETINEDIRAICQDARSMGAEVAIATPVWAYDRKPALEDEPKLESIQANWRSYIETRAEYDFRLTDEIEKNLAPSMDIPVLDLSTPIHNHPHRYEMHFDMGHLNARGMAVKARAIYAEIDRLGWWDGGDTAANA